MMEIALLVSDISMTISNAPATIRPTARLFMIILEVVTAIRYDGNFLNY